MDKIICFGDSNTYGCDASLRRLPMAFDGIHLTEEANHIFADEIERII